MPQIRFEDWKRFGIEIFTPDHDKPEPEMYYEYRQASNRPRSKSSAHSSHEPTIPSRNQRSNSHPSSSMYAVDPVYSGSRYQPPRPTMRRATLTDYYCPDLDWNLRRALDCRTFPRHFGTHKSQEAIWIKFHLFRFHFHFPLALNLPVSSYYYLHPHTDVLPISILSFFTVCNSAIFYPLSYCFTPLPLDHILYSLPFPIHTTHRAAPFFLCLGICRMALEVPWIISSIYFYSFNHLLYLSRRLNAISFSWGSLFSPRSSQQNQVQIGFMEIVYLALCKGSISFNSLYCHFVGRYSASCNYERTFKYLFVSIQARSDQRIGTENLPPPPLLLPQYKTVNHQ